MLPFGIRPIGEHRTLSDTTFLKVVFKGCLDIYINVQN